MSAKGRGSRAERKVKAQLEGEGWLVVKAGGSLGAADLLACRAGRIMLVQVKAGGRSDYEHFPPEEREQLRDAARRAGGEAWLVRCYPRRPPKWVPEAEWPGGPSPAAQAIRPAA